MRKEIFFLFLSIFFMLGTNATFAWDETPPSIVEKKSLCLKEAESNRSPPCKDYYADFWDWVENDLKCLEWRIKAIKTCHKIYEEEIKSYNSMKKNSNLIPSENIYSGSDSVRSCDSLDVNANLFGIETDDLEVLKKKYFDYRTQKALQADQYYEDIRASTLDFLGGEIFSPLKDQINESVSEKIAKEMANAFKKHFLDTSEEVSKDVADKIAKQVLKKIPEFSKVITSRAQRAAIALSLTGHLAANSIRIYKLSQTASTGDLENMIYRKQEYLSSRSKTLLNYYNSSGCKPPEQFSKAQKKVDFLTSDLNYFSEIHRTQGGPPVSFPVDKTPYHVQKHEKLP